MGLLMIRCRLLLLVGGAFITLPVSAAAQAAPAAPQVLTLDRAIQYAVEHYPTVRAALEQVNESAAGVAVARTAYMPRLDSLWQSNRGTANNVFGQVLPQSVIPAMSGPVLSSSSADSVWGSAVGALFSWEPLDFGLRHATVAGAEAAVTRARAAQALTQLEVQGAVGAAFLNIAADQRAVAAAQADFDRRDVLRRIVQTLVDNQLRPGAEASRADAERAAAQTRLIRAQQTLALADVLLKRVLGVMTGRITIDASNLVDTLPSGDLPATPSTGHPLAQVHQAAVDQAHAEQEVLAQTDLPRVYLQTSVLARGSGANAIGPFDGGFDGLSLDRANWVAGVQVVFPNVFDYSALRARKSAAAASARAEGAMYDEALLTVTSERQAASATVQAARAIAANTPVQLAAARQSEAQARARYQAGLANIVEVADAQSLLAQAEVQDQVARVDVWRALLGEAVAQGDFKSLISLIPPSAGAR